MSVSAPRPPRASQSSIDYPDDPFINETITEVAPRPRWRDDTTPRPPQALDPYGIYGTRSEQRVVAARQRRAAQQITALCALAGLVTGVVIFSRRPRVPVSSGVRVAWAQMPGAAPVLAANAGDARLLIPSQSGDLQSFDPANGKLTSLLDTAFPLRATPLVVDNVAYVPCEDGSLYAVDWRTGRALWQRGTGAPLSACPALVALDFPARPPLLGTATRRFVVIGNDAGLIQCLEAGTGRVLWQRRADAPVGSGIVAVPRVDNSTNNLRDNPAPRVLVPLLDGASTRGGLWCLDARSGAVLWKFPQAPGISAPQLAPPALDLAGGRLFCGDDTGAMLCLRLRDGKRLWKTYARAAQSERNAVLLRGAALFLRDGFGERVIIGGNDGNVRAFSAQNGRLLWSYDAGAPVRGKPLAVQSEGRSALLISCDDARLWLLNAQNGQVLREVRTDGGAAFAPSAWNNAFYVATARGSLEKIRF